MENPQEPSASLCNGSRDISMQNQEAKATPGRRRLTRSVFTTSFTSRNMKSFPMEEEEDEERKDGTEVTSPRGVLEECSVSIESETSSKPCTSDSFESETTFPPASTSCSEGQQCSVVTAPWRDFFRVLRKGPSASFQTLPPLKKGVPKLSKRKSSSRKFRETIVPSLNAPLDGEFCHFKSSWKNFSLSELQTATDNFSHENLIGEGGYAEVYRGNLEDDQLVAIKRLTRGSPEEMTVDFLSELGILVHVDHPNIAKVIGYGVEGGMHLVLELSANGSLASLLYGSKEKLDWGIRYKIAIGTAQGLLYLHEECQRRIIHKDIKASNILLSKDFEPQISDFGLAKWLPEEWSHHTVSKIEGTFGYLPPEFFMHGIVDEKTDVYAYGVLLLELITGRQALDTSQQSLVMWAKPLLMNNRIEELVDPTIAGAYEMEEIDRVVGTASMCIHQCPSDRPQMNQVVKILRGDTSSLKDLKQRQSCKHQRTYSEELFDEDDYNSTKCLSDLNQYMEVVLRQCDEKSEEGDDDSTGYLIDANQETDKVVLRNSQS